VLARQMGGDAPMLAQVLTIQTALAVLTMPVFIAFAEGITGR
jgi:malonate transporter and related proteins